MLSVESRCKAGSAGVEALSIKGDTSSQRPLVIRTWRLLCYVGISTELCGGLAACVQDPVQAGP